MEQSCQRVKITEEYKRCKESKAEGFIEKEKRGKVNAGRKRGKRLTQCKEWVENKGKNKDGAHGGAILVGEGSTGRNEGGGRIQ